MNTKFAGNAGTTQLKHNTTVKHNASLTCTPMKILTPLSVAFRGQEAAPNVSIHVTYLLSCGLCTVKGQEGY